MSAQTEALRAALNGDVIEVVEECGWITTHARVDGEIVTWRVANPRAIWLRRYRLVSDMTIREIDAAIKSLELRIGQLFKDRELRSLEKQIAHGMHPQTVYVRHALHCIERRKDWQLWIERLQFELQERRKRELRAAAKPNLRDLSWSSLKSYSENSCRFLRRVGEDI